MKKLLIIISLGMVCLTQAKVNAQDASDFSTSALDLSFLYPGGSARIQAIGGAATSLGGDISAAGINPAGLGFYNRSEFSITPELNLISSDGTYLGNTVTDNLNSFVLANMGVVIHRDINNGKWMGGAFGITFNRVANFQNSYVYDGENSLTDFIDFSVDSENGFGLVPNDLSLLAFNTFLTDEFYTIYEGQETISINGFDYGVEDLYGPDVQLGDSLYFIDRNIYRGNDLGFPTEADPVNQRELIRTRGGVNQMNLSYGINYDDRVYLGMGLGMMLMNKEVERTYIETPSNTDLLDMTLTDYFNTSGIGVNATFGIILRPVGPLKIAASYTTPSWYSLEQTRELALLARFNNEFFEDGFIYNNFRYNMRTPGRARLGASFFLGKFGFISADLESVNYSGAELTQPSEGDFVFDNEVINSFNNVINYRLGAEARLDIFRLRAGYAHYADPTDDDIDNAMTQISAGVGIRTGSFFIDFAAVTGINSEREVSPYPTSETAAITTQTNRLTLSIGMVF